MENKLCTNFHIFKVCSIIYLIWHYIILSRKGDKLLLIFFFKKMCFFIFFVLNNYTIYMLVTYTKFDLWHFSFFFVFQPWMHLSSRKYFLLSHIVPRSKDNGSVALLLHFTSSEVRFLDLVFLCGAGGPGNTCYGFKCATVNFALHFKWSAKVKQIYHFLISKNLFEKSAIKNCTWSEV